MALIEAISPEAARTLIDELAAKYSPEILQTLLINGVKGGLAGLTITLTIEGGAVKVTVG